MPSFYKHPTLIIVVCLALTVFFTLQLPKLQMENDAASSFMPKKHPSYAKLIQNEDDFTSTSTVGISIETVNSSILTVEDISVIKNITDKIETVENVDLVDSLTNIDYVCEEEGGIKASPLIDEDLFTYDDNGNASFIGTEKDLLDIGQKMVGWEDMYDRVIISDNGRASQIQIILKKKTMKDGKEVEVSGDERLDSLHAIRDIVEQHIKDTELKYAIYGDPVVSDDSKSYMAADLFHLIPLVAVVVLATLFFSFKTFDGTIFPLLTVLISTIWSCGIMSLFKIPFTIISSVIPVALIAVGSAYGIHVMTHYYIMIEKEKKKPGFVMTKEEHGKIIWEGLKDVFVAVLLAGLTTMLGFISLITSPLESFHSFAVFTTLGVFLSLLLSVTLIPAMLLLKPLDKIGKKSKRMEKFIQKTRAKTQKRLKKIHLYDEHKESGSTLYNAYNFFAGTKPRLTVFCLALLTFSIIGLRLVDVDTAVINYFPSTSKIRQDVDYVNDNFAGSNSVYMLISQEGGEQDKELSSTNNLNNLNEESSTNNTTSETEEFDFEHGFDALDDLDAGFNDTDNSTSNEDFSDSVFNDFDDLDSLPIPSEEGVNSSSINMANNTTGEEGGSLDMTNVDLLVALDNLQNYLKEKYTEIGKIVSFTTFVKRMNQVMNAPYATPLDTSIEVAGYVDPNIEHRKLLESNMSVNMFINALNNAYVKAGGKSASMQDIIDIVERELNFNGMDFYEIPYKVTKYPVASKEELNKLVSQYLILLGGDTLRRFAYPLGSFTPTKLRTQLQLRTHSTSTVNKIIKDATKYAKNHFPKGYKLEFTGTGELDCIMTNMIIPSQMSSLLLSLLSVFFIISLSFRSILAGLIGVIPLAFTIILNYMVMGLTGIKLDLVTSIIASVAVGVGIDYTIHFLETFHNERLNSDDMEVVLKNTFNKSGVGIITNALAVGLGFLVLCLSKFIVLRYVGVLVAGVMCFSSVLALTILPGILNLYDPAFMRRGKSKDAISTKFTTNEKADSIKDKE